MTYEKKMLDIQYYLNQIEFLEFKEISDDTWETIEIEGLNEEKNLYKPVEWEEAFLEITYEDKYGIMNREDIYLNKFNDFDWQLKERYKMKYTDLIDESHGTIKIVRPKE